MTVETDKQKLRCKVLVDSGASVSIADEDFCKLHNLYVHPLSGEAPFVSVDGRKLNITGTVNLTIVIEGVRAKIALYVMPNLPNTLLFGIDVLRQFGANIDLLNHQVQWQTLGVQSTLVSRDGARGVWRTAERTVLQPGQVATIALIVPRRVTDKMDYILESLPTRRTNGRVHVLPTVVRPVTNRVKCVVVNQTDTQCSLPKRHPIAAIRPVRCCNDSVATVNSLQNSVNAIAVPMGVQMEGGTEPKKPTPKQPSDFSTFMDKLQYLTTLGINLQQNEMTDEQHEKMADILIEYSDCFLPKKGAG